MTADSKPSKATTTSTPKSLKMNIVRLLTLFILLILISASHTRAQTFTLEAETGGLWFSRNDVRIPNEGGTRFDMTELIGKDPDIY